MKRSDVELQILRIFRQITLRKDDSLVLLSRPLGDLGLGLDSLALVEFVAALEATYSIIISDSVWTERGQLSLSDFVSIVMDSGAEGVQDVPHIANEQRNVPASNASYRDRLVHEIRQEGIFRASGWFFGRAFRRLLGSVYASEVHLILRHDLRRIPDYRTFSKRELVFREATCEDRTALGSLWTKHQQSRRLRLFDERLRGHFICLSAWEGNEIVGIDYITPVGDFDRDTGLRVKTAEGSCYGIDLYEKYPGEGIGLALLGYSLGETKRRGYQRQVAFVKRENIRMHTAAIQLFGFTEIGRIQVRRVFGRASSLWELSGRHGKDTTIVV